MSKLLIHEPPIQFSQSLAVEIGVDRAIILQQMHYWLQDCNQRVYIGGIPWIDRIHYRCCDEFLMWEKDIIYQKVDSLMDTGHIITRKFEGRGELYTIDYEHVERENE